MSIEQAPQDRLPALDAVRGYALLLGVVLHSCAAFLQDFPMPLWRLEASAGPAAIYYVIHVFRMSAFYLMAGFFGRLLLERRGARSFVADRAKRILVPLVLGLPLVEITGGLFLVAGLLPHGTAYLQELVRGAQAGAPAGPAPPSLLAAVNLQHLWFLYYLLIFYGLALALRALLEALDSRGALPPVCDRAVRFLMSGPWGAVLLAVPAALYYWPLSSWNEWTGLPAPTSLIPDGGALIGYGTVFALGWLLHRQVSTLLALGRYWLLYLVLFIGLVVLCLSLIGVTPRWQGPNLHGVPRALYIGAYMVAVWCGVFAAVGAAVRFLSAPSATTRYLADASYWIYLMHLGTIVFFVSLLRPYHLHWALMLPIMTGGSLLILLPSYHYLVRFSWVGAILNGRRRARTAGPAPAGVARPPDVLSGHTAGQPGLDRASFSAVQEVD